MHMLHAHLSIHATVRTRGHVQLFTLATAACRWHEFVVSERPVTVGELVGAHSEGRLLEAFGTGTASVVQPIAALVRQTADGTQRLEIPGKALPGKALVTQRLSKQLQDIQYGRVQSEWSEVFDG
jgi:branched-chain amino acid aminotransferase